MFGSSRYDSKFNILLSSLSLLRVLYHRPLTPPLGPLVLPLSSSFFGKRRRVDRWPRKRSSARQPRKWWKINSLLVLSTGSCIRCTKRGDALGGWIMEFLWEGLQNRRGLTHHHHHLHHCTAAQSSSLWLYLRHSLLFARPIVPSSRSGRFSKRSYI